MLSGNPSGFSKYIWGFSSQLRFLITRAEYSQGHRFISTRDSFLPFLQLYFPSLNMLQWIYSMLKKNNSINPTSHSCSGHSFQILYSQETSIIYVLFTIITLYCTPTICQTRSFTWFHLTTTTHKISVWVKKWRFRGVGRVVQDTAARRLCCGEDFLHLFPLLLMLHPMAAQLLPPWSHCIGTPHDHQWPWLKPMENVPSLPWPTSL